MEQPKEYKQPTQKEKDYDAMCDKAADLGAEYAEWDYDQLTQSAEYANDIMPALRELAGFVDTMKTGCFTSYPDDATEEQKDVIESNLEAAFDAFEQAYWDNHEDFADENEEED